MTQVVEPDTDDFTLAGDIAQTVVTTIANKQKDRADEALDAQRVHDGMTLDEFMAKQG